MVKTIRQQMLELCEEMKRQFLESTGVELVCFPKIIPIDIGLVELRRKVLNFTDEDPLDNSSRRIELIRAKRFFLITAREMGHKEETVMKYMKQERTGLYNHIDRHEQLMKNSKTYQESYNKFINTLHEAEAREEGTEVL